jgi:hypothetical protein
MSLNEAAQPPVLWVGVVAGVPAGRDGQRRQLGEDRVAAHAGGRGESADGESGEEAGEVGARDHGMSAPAVVTLLTGVFLLPRSRSLERPRLDPVGALLSVAGIAGLLYGFIEAPDYGWTSPQVVGPLLALPAGLERLPSCALLKEAGDHSPAVFLEGMIADAMGPDDGTEALPQRLDREQFGVLALDCAPECGHEGALALGMTGELLVLQSDEVADPGTILATLEVDDCDPAVVDDPITWLVVAVREVQANRPGREAAGPFSQGGELGRWHEALGFCETSADGGERLFCITV